MEKLEQIKEQISQCDDKIINALVERMNYTRELISYKKENGIPILQPEQDEKQLAAFMVKIKENQYKNEILDTFLSIVKNSKKIQAKALFSYNIMLIGFMGTGKSTVSDYLGEMFAMDQIEMDALIASKEGMSIAEIFEEYGEEYFRDCESNTLIELQKENNVVISCGGGVVLREENIKYMKKKGKIVLLTANPETIYDRVKGSAERPILNNNMNVGFISELMEKRRVRYEMAADIIINTDGKSIQRICEELIGKLTAMES